MKLEKESILWKIKKLLALGDATRNSSPEEAALAAAKVHVIGADLRGARIFNTQLSADQLDPIKK